MLIKCKFLKEGKPTGRAYTYNSVENMVVGDKVFLPGGGHGVVTAIDVPESEVEAFKDKIKYIDGKEPTDDGKEI